MREEKKCLGCGHMFDISNMPSCLKEKRNYCTRDCFYKRTKLLITKDIKCAHCEDVFIKKGTMPPPNYKSRRFCGRRCAASYRWDRHRDNFIDSFWLRVDKKGPDDCWLWEKKSRGIQGYGRINYKGKMLISHRVAYRFTKGSIKEGMYILHSCDNPPCCNPAHLREGTHLENMADMTKRKRRPGLHRDINPSSKVSAALKIKIIKDYDDLPRGPCRVKRGELGGLAKKYKVSRHLINDLVRHRHI